MSGVAYMGKRIEVRATEPNAHFLGIVMAASVRREGGKLVILRHDLHMEVPLGHWITLKDGNAEVTEVREFGF